MNAAPPFDPADFDDFDPCPWCGSKHPHWYMCEGEYKARRRVQEAQDRLAAALARRLARPSRN